MSEGLQKDFKTPITKKRKRSGSTRSGQRSNIALEKIRYNRYKE